MIAPVAAVGGLTLGAASIACAATRAASRPVQASPDVLRLRVIGVRDDRIEVRAWTLHGTEHDVRLTARRGHQVLASGQLATVSPLRRTVELTVRRGVSTKERFTVTASADEPVAPRQTTSNTSS